MIQLLDSTLPPIENSWARHRLHLSKMQFLKKKKSYKYNLSELMRENEIFCKRICPFSPSPYRNNYLKDTKNNGKQHKSSALLCPFVHNTRSNNYHY